MLRLIQSRRKADTAVALKMFARLPGGIKKNFIRK